MTANTCMSLTNYSCICKKTSLRFRESKPWKTIKIIKSRKIHVTSFSSIFCWIVLYSSNWAHLDSWEARLSNSYSVISQVWMIFIWLSFSRGHQPQSTLWYVARLGAQNHVWKKNSKKSASLVRLFNFKFVIVVFVNFVNFIKFAIFVLAWELLVLLAFSHEG